MKSIKEVSVESKILKRLQNRPECLKLVNYLIEDEELQEMQDYANNVSIKRLGYNDHGPVHMHDLGMMIGRQGHEEMSVILAKPIVERALMEVFPHDLHRRVVIRSVVIEAIIGHMASRKIHSTEAGIILIADGCDMTKGRARIPLSINTMPKVGDIHKYSANAINRIRIQHGERKPIKISVEMSADVGFFQVEEVLITKIDSSPAKQFVELYAGVEGQEPKCYL